MGRPTHLVRASPPTKGFAPDLVERVLDLALASPGNPPVFGITGLQGSGKSTLAAQLVAAARQRGLSAVSLSIDDFYLGKRERAALARDSHPLLATRGPPGTHAVSLACRTLDGLRTLPAGESLRLPAFDKLADRRLSPSKSPLVTSRPQVIVLEGWFLGLPPQPAEALAEPVNTLEHDEDPDGTWRRHCNEALAHYASLWCRIDRLLFLHGPGFDVVPAWRWQQEQALAKGKRATMTEAEIARFVLFFERLSRHGLATLPRLADHVIRLDSERRPIG